MRSVLQKNRIWVVALVLLFLHGICYMRQCESNELSQKYDTKPVSQEEYQSTWNEIENEIQIKQTFSIFSEDSLFAKRNLEKQENDFAKGQHIEVKSGNNKMFLGIIADTTLPLCMAVFMCYMVLQFQRERECGVWTVVHTLKYGRGNLAAKRCAFLLLGIAGFGMALYGQTILIAWKYFGGNVLWSRAIQSVSLFQKLPYPISLGELLAGCVLAQILGMYTIGVCLFLIFSAWRHRLFAYLTTGILIGAEWLLTLLPEQSPFVLAKYWNLYQFANMGQIMLSYRNLPLPMGKITGVIPFCIGSCLFTCIAGVVLSVYVNETLKPAFGTGRIMRKVLACTNAIRRVQMVLPQCGMELYKQLVGQKKWCVWAVFLVLCLPQPENQRIVYTEKQNLVNQFYTQFEGKELQDVSVQEYFKNQRRQNKKAEKIYADAVKSFQRNEISMDEYEEAGFQYKKNEVKQKAYRELQKENDRLLQVEKKTGQKMVYVNPMSFSRIFSNHQWKNQIKKAMLSMAVLLLLLYDVCSYEKRKGMFFGIRSTPEGLGILLRQKTWIAVGEAVLVWCVVNFSEWRTLLAPSVRAVWNAPAGSVKYLDDVSVSCSIGQICVATYGIRLVFCILFALMVLYLSGIFEGTTVMIVVLACLLLPTVGYYVGVPFMGKIAIGKCFVGYRYGNEKWYKLLLYMLALFLMCVGAVLRGIQKWYRRECE